LHHRKEGWLSEEDISKHPLLRSRGVTARNKKGKPPRLPRFGRCAKFS
jgi:hypothetical protein